MRVSSDYSQVSVGSVTVGHGLPLALIAGPCVLESQALTFQIVETVRDICRSLEIPYIFKASFDKANRSSIHSHRGPGISEGLAVLKAVREQYQVPVVTDIHSPEQAAPVSEVVDLLQIPAFLCRQTDLLVAAARTSKPVNVKKAQFMAPWEMEQVKTKLTVAGASGIMFTERGSSFGYNTLVSDFRAIPIMRNLGVPVVFDATHSVQQPGAQGTCSGGQREFVPYLAKAAVAVGADVVFLEVHPDPDQALSDGPNSLPLDQLEPLLAKLKTISQALPS